MKKIAFLTAFSLVSTFYVNAQPPKTGTANNSNQKMKAAKKLPNTIASQNKKDISMETDKCIRVKITTDSGIIILYSEPLCLEGMLLSVLKQNIPHTAQKCKSMLHPQLSDNPALPKSYDPLFAKPVLDETNHATV